MLGFLVGFLGWRFFRWTEVVKGIFYLEIKGGYGIFLRVFVSRGDV